MTTSYLAMTEDLARSAKQYGAVRTARYILAERRGRGLFTSKFNDTKSVFIHVPKAAGNSVAKAIYGKETGHYPAFLYRLVSQEKFNRYFTFAIVRNPWDRLVSAFHYLKQGGKTETDKIWALENISKFENFDSFVRNWVTPSNIMKGIHFWPQSHFLCDSENKIIVNYVGRLETIQVDFSNIAKRIGIGSELRSENLSTHRHYLDYYTKETSDIVASVYAADISAFGYDPT